MSEAEFVNSFWGLNDNGFGIVQTKIKQSLGTLQELLHFYKEKIAIEKEYNKRLEKLQHESLGSSETGSLKVALDKLQGENSNMLAHNNKYIRNILLHNYDRLHKFYQIYHRNVSKIETHMSKVMVRKKDLFKHLSEAKERYRTECSQIKSLQLVCTTTWGNEQKKNEAKIARLQQSLGALRSAYQQSVARCREIHEIWVRDWLIALLNLYQLEVERVQVLKLNCFNYCNHVAALCVDWDSAVDAARTSFAKVAAPKDVHDFAGEYGTGNRIGAPPKFVDFSAGLQEEDAHYTVADFKDPDYAPILSRTYLMHLGVSQSTSLSKSEVLPRKQYHKLLPPIKEPLSAPSTFEEQPLVKRKSQNSSKSSDEREEIFEEPAGLNYSVPTNYSSHTVRSWASPRRKSRLEVQEQINRRLRDMTGQYPAQEPPKPVPIAKDFSIDYIAKALEDLNAGGDGDVNQFRRSVREHNDSAETATRLDSISFRTPQKPRLTHADADSLTGTIVRRGRLLLQLPTKLYRDLHSMVVAEKSTPRHGHPFVTKAVAKYSYNAQEDGELSFRKGWQMYIVHKQEDNWYVCELAESCGASAGKMGLVPYNYVAEGDGVF